MKYLDSLLLAVPFLVSQPAPDTIIAIPEGWRNTVWKLLNPYMPWAVVLQSMSAG